MPTARTADGNGQDGHGTWIPTARTADGNGQDGHGGQDGCCSMTRGSWPMVAFRLVVMANNGLAWTA